MKYQISKLPPLLKKYKCNIFFSKKVNHYTRQLVSQICVSAGFVAELSRFIKWNTFNFWNKSYKFVIEQLSLKWTKILVTPKVIAVAKGSTVYFCTDTNPYDDQHNSLCWQKVNKMYWP